MKVGLMLASILLITLSFGLVASYTPVVLMHGIVAGADSLDHAEALIKRELPGIYVRRVEIGNGALDSVFWSIEHQQSSFCGTLKSDSRLAGGVNLIGFSQGGMITRGYLERCNDPPVHNFISWVSPQGGGYGVPIVGHYPFINKTLDEIVDCCIYDSWAQDHISFAGYWRDPFNLDKYIKDCKYLPDLNNERAQKNNLYKQRILSLKNFVMSYSVIDNVLIPRQTGWFGVFQKNSDHNVVPLEQQPLYQEDWIGLKQLQQTGRLHKFVTSCDHGDYSSSCFDKYFLANVIPFLKL